MARRLDQTRKRDARARRLLRRRSAAPRASAASTTATQRLWTLRVRSWGRSRSQRSSRVRSGRRARVTWRTTRLRRLPPFAARHSPAPPLQPRGVSPPVRRQPMLARRERSPTGLRRQRAATRAPNKQQRLRTSPAGRPLSRLAIRRRPLLASPDALKPRPAAQKERPTPRAPRQQAQRALARATAPTAALTATVVAAVLAQARSRQAGRPQAAPRGSAAATGVRLRRRLCEWRAARRTRRGGTPRPAAAATTRRWLVPAAPAASSRPPAAGSRLPAAREAAFAPATESPLGSRTSRRGIPSGSWRLRRSRPSRRRSSSSATWPNAAAPGRARTGTPSWSSGRRPRRPPASSARGCRPAGRPR
mmetsp:Transcript_4631/g.19734  ORF Transcript_4631/g.19734 Transcript_4631/m.19734 type:complete len:363 (-) Transcript_4631:913-2001(-)